jgi:hypothetical protein
MESGSAERRWATELSAPKATLSRKWVGYFLFGIIAIFISQGFDLPAWAQTCGGTVKCRCGDTLIADRTLANDPIVQSACPDDGLIIGASGVTLDLRTKAIKGSGNGVGVFVPAGVHDVTITGRPPGRVQFFGTGIHIAPGASQVTVSGVQAYYHTGDGILIEGDHNTIINSPGRHDGNNGLTVLDGNNNVITGLNNEYNGDNGFFVRGHFNELIANKASENDKNRQGQGIGIEVIGDNNIIRLSELTKLNTHGIVVVGDNNFLEGNSTAKHKLNGITVTGDNAVLINNKATNGKTAPQSIGILVQGNGDPFASSGNTSDQGVCRIYGVTGQGVCNKIAVAP